MSLYVHENTNSGTHALEEMVFDSLKSFGTIPRVYGKLELFIGHFTKYATGELLLSQAIYANTFAYILKGFSYPQFHTDSTTIRWLPHSRPELFCMNIRAGKVMSDTVCE